MRHRGSVRRRSHVRMDGLRRVLILLVLLIMAFLGSGEAPMHALVPTEDLGNLAQSIIIAKESVKQVLLLKEQLNSMKDLKGQLKSSLEALGVPGAKELLALLEDDIFSQDFLDGLKRITDTNTNVMQLAEEALLGWNAMSPEEKAELSSYIDEQQKAKQQELRILHNRLGDYGSRMQELIADSNGQDVTVISCLQNIMGGLGLMSSQLSELIGLVAAGQELELLRKEKEQWQAQKTAVERPRPLDPAEFAKINAPSRLQKLPGLGSNSTPAWIRTGGSGSSRAGRRGGTL